MHIRRELCLVIALIGLSAPDANAQQQVIFQSAPSATQPQTQATTAYTQQQLDQMLAPVALYPDPLIGQILMASTYPLEIVEASRWLQNPQNAAMKGDQLAAAMAQEPWDPSVKSLVPFPQVLSMMDKNLQWTEQLGDAFIANQAAVMDTVQHLRQMAQASGHLASNAQETVSTEDGAIVIQPPTPQTVYLPYYNPSAVYGVWPYPDYPPYYFPAPPGYVYYNTGPVGFGVGILVVGSLWGWDHWDWHRHHMNIDDRRWSGLDNHRSPPASGVWQHDPGHRHGVPYHSEEARAQFGQDRAQAHANYRGFSPHANEANAPAAHTEDHRSFDRNDHNIAPAPQSRMVAPQTIAPQASEPHTVVRQMQTRGQMVQSHNPPNVQFHQPNARSAPAFESFSRGQDVHTQAARGAASLATVHAAPQAVGHGAGENRGGDHGGSKRGDNHDNGPTSH